MARGKHASSAEARRARESAEAEVIAGRRKIASLTTEVETLRATLTQERTQNTERLRHYVALMEEGSSPEVESLRKQVASLTMQLEQDRLDRARRVASVLAETGPAWVDISEGTHIKVADALGVPLSVLFEPVAKSRLVRRMTKKSSNRAHQGHLDAAASGLKLEGRW